MHQQRKKVLAHVSCCRLDRPVSLCLLSRKGSSDIFAQLVFFAAIVCDCICAAQNSTMHHQCSSGAASPEMCAHHTLLDAQWLCWPLRWLPPSTTYRRRLCLLNTKLWVLAALFFIIIIVVLYVVLLYCKSITHTNQTAVYIMFNGIIFHVVRQILLGIIK